MRRAPILKYIWIGIIIMVCLAMLAELLVLVF